jgi:hypothetical protein
VPAMKVTECQRLLADSRRGPYARAFKHGHSSTGELVLSHQPLRINAVRLVSNAAEVFRVYLANLDLIVVTPAS